MYLIFPFVGVICVVVAIFYLVGWEMGAVEAVSLSILVGSSVDYCVHVVEGYLLAGENPPPSAMQVSKYLMVHSHCPIPRPIQIPIKFL